MKQICELVHCSESVLEIILPIVQQQPIGVDCGVFAIAFAVGIFETGKRFDVGKIRSHLLKCLEEKEFTLFLISHKHTKLSKGYITYVDIITYVGAHSYEEDSERAKNLFMAKYAKCSEWYHKICLKISSRVFTKISVQWKCMRC